jgi:enoyl-CoA hydratase
MSDAADVAVGQVGQVGRIRLTRPKALNALSHEMANAMDAALKDWQAGGQVRLVLVDAEGGKAFCAGGDIAQMYRFGLNGDYDACRRFWTDEYRLNARIDHYPTPYVALMDGIVMGGGVGISGHGSHRVVTERSMVAMPECAIGLVPDVGGTWLLSRAPGYLGEFLGLTGWRMSGADALLAGFADMAIASENLAAAAGALEQRADPAALDAFRLDLGPAPLEGHLATIDRHFSHETALECLHSLESDPSDFAQQAAAMIRRASPLSVAATFALVRGARELTRIEEALVAEYRFSYRSMTDAQFLEGIRAQIIDKDRNPRWLPDRLEEESAEAVHRMLAPLGAAELTF